jgi:hypothetical protein
VVAAGAPVGDLLGGIRWFLSGHRMRQVDIGQPVLVPGRPLLESLVRARVRALPEVVVADDRVTTIDVDLVVDACGVQILSQPRDLGIVRGRLGVDIPKLNAFKL